MANPGGTSAGRAEVSVLLRAEVSIQSAVVGAWPAHEHMAPAKDGVNFIVDLPPSMPRHSTRSDTSRLDHLHGLVQCPHLGGLVVKSVAAPATSETGFFRVADDFRQLRDRFPGFGIRWDRLRERGFNSNSSVCKCMADLNSSISLSQRSTCTFRAGLRGGRQVRHVHGFYGMMAISYLFWCSRSECQQYQHTKHGDGAAVHLDLAVVDEEGALQILHIHCIGFFCQTASRNKVHLVTVGAAHTGTDQLGRAVAILKFGNTISRFEVLDQFTGQNSLDTALQQ
jgi:hypothetical protein